MEGDFNSAEVSFTPVEKGGMIQLIQNADVRFKGLLKVLDDSNFAGYPYFFQIEINLQV